MDDSSMTQRITKLESELGLCKEALGGMAAALRKAIDATLVIPELEAALRMVVRDSFFTKQRARVAADSAFAKAQPTHALMRDVREWLGETLAVDAALKAQP